MKSKIKEVNWYELIYKATEINTACTNFTDNFMGICKLYEKTTRSGSTQTDGLQLDSGTDFDDCI